MRSTYRVAPVALGTTENNEAALGPHGESNFEMVGCADQSRARRSEGIGERTNRRSVARSVNLGRASQASTWKLRAVPCRRHSHAHSYWSTADSGPPPLGIVLGTLADEGMIIDRKNPNRLRVAAHDSLRTLFRENFSANHERRGDAALA
jgi:hypothetical protein